MQSAAEFLRSELAPWHMWGTNEALTLSGTAAEFTSHQLVKINYGRPETWRWLFAVQLETALAALDTLEIDFDLTVGVGRASVQLRNFAVFTFAGPANSGVIQWTTKDTSPVANELIVSQDLQLGARMRGNFAPTETKIVAATAFFAPNVHIRPEWFTADESDNLRYRGAENNGT